MSQPRYATQTRADTPVSLATVALIVALLLPPVGVVLGVLARREVRRTGGTGARTAQAAIVLGVALTLLWALLGAYFFVLFANSGVLLPGPPIPN